MATVLEPSYCAEYKPPENSGLKQPFIMLTGFVGQEFRQDTERMTVFYVAWLPHSMADSGWLNFIHGGFQVRYFWIMKRLTPLSYPNSEVTQHL